MGTSYSSVKCKKCGGMKTVVEDDGQDDPQTFFVKVPERCKC